MSSAYEELPPEDRSIEADEVTNRQFSDPQVVEMSVVRRTPPSLALLGLLTVLVGIWAGIVPFVGPLFGYSPDFTPSFTWNLAHALLNFAPGVAAIVAGLWILAGAPSAGAGLNRFGLSGAGLLSIVAGSWLVIGPYAWPSMYGSFFATTSPLGRLAQEIGYALGPGLLLAVFGGLALGWAIRADRVEVATVHRRLRHGSVATLRPGERAS